MSSCHTFEHQNINLTDKQWDLRKQRANNQELKIKNKGKVLEKKRKIVQKDLAPIITPKKTERVKTITLNSNKIKSNSQKFSINMFMNLSESNLITIMGNSDFIKEEGKLKNYQYHFTKCFLDIFLMKKNKSYTVNYIQTRPTKLNGKLQIDKCFKEISKKIN